MGGPVTDARMLARALANPSSVVGLDAEGWTALLAMARAEQLIGTLAVRLDGLAMPNAVKYRLGRVVSDAMFLNLPARRVAT